MNLGCSAIPSARCNIRPKLRPRLRRNFRPKLRPNARDKARSKAEVVEQAIRFAYTNRADPPTVVGGETRERADIPASLPREPRARPWKRDGPQTAERVGENGRNAGTRVLAGVTELPHGPAWMLFSKLWDPSWRLSRTCWRYSDSAPLPTWSPYLARSPQPSPSSSAALAALAARESRANHGVRATAVTPGADATLRDVRRCDGPRAVCCRA